MPVAVPGAAVSPGTSNCNFTKAPELTVMEGLVLALFVPSVTSLAVSVALPAVLRVMLNTLVPEMRPLFAGKAALLSLQVMATMSVALVTRFQKVSTALAVTLKAVPAV